MSKIQIAIVIHSNNAIEIASNSLTELFHSFKNSNPELEIPSEPIKSTDKYNYGNTFIDYKFIMHKTINYGRVVYWHEYNRSDNPNKWREIKELTIYPNKKNTSVNKNATLSKNRRSMNVLPRGTPMNGPPRGTPMKVLPMGTSMNGPLNATRRTPNKISNIQRKIVVQTNSGGFWDAKPKQQIAYIKFLENPEKSKQIVLDNGEYFNFKEIIYGDNMKIHQIQDRKYPNKWRLIKYVNY